MGRNLAAMDDDCTVRSIVFGMVDAKIGEISIRYNRFILVRLRESTNSALNTIKNNRMITTENRPQLVPAVIRRCWRTMRRRVRRYVWAEGIADSLTWLGAAFWITLAVDWFFEPPVLVRIMIFCAAVGVLAVILIAADRTPGVRAAYGRQHGNRAGAAFPATKRQPAYVRGPVRPARETGGLQCGNAFPRLPRRRPSGFKPCG